MQLQKHRRSAHGSQLLPATPSACMSPHTTHAVAALLPFLLPSQMAVGFKKCRKYFDMLDSNGDRCVGSSFPWAGKQQHAGPSSACMCGPAASTPAPGALEVSMS
jgi:hypothetical protein